jgi:hypothetical protein
VNTQDYRGTQYHTGPDALQDSSKPGWTPSEREIGLLTESCWCSRAGRRQNGGRLTDRVRAVALEFHAPCSCGPWLGQRAVWTQPISSAPGCTGLAQCGRDVALQTVDVIEQGKYGISNVQYTSRLDELPIQERFNHLNFTRKVPTRCNRRRRTAAVPGGCSRFMPHDGFSIDFVRM